MKATRIARPQSNAAKISFRVLMGAAAYRPGRSSYSRRVPRPQRQVKHPMKDALGAVQSVLVLGGGSEIAQATVDRLVADRCRTVVLAGRDVEALSLKAEALRMAGAPAVEVMAFDASDVASHHALITKAFAELGDIDLVLMAFGVLGDQDHFDTAPEAAAKAAVINYAGGVSAGLAVAECLRRQGHGTLAVITSVAGVRVRADNVVYGSTKAGLDAFAQGLGDRLQGSGADVMVIRPGFVRTKMTSHLEDGPMATTADAVADDIIAGLRKGAHTVWSPAKLRVLLAVLRLLPRPLWRKVAATR